MIFEKGRKIFTEARMTDGADLVYAEASALLIAQRDVFGAKL